MKPQLKILLISALLLAKAANSYAVTPPSSATEKCKTDKSWYLACIKNNGTCYVMDNNALLKKSPYRYYCQVPATETLTEAQLQEKKNELFKTACDKAFDQGKEAGFLIGVEQGKNKENKDALLFACFRNQ